VAILPPFCRSSQSVPADWHYQPEGCLRVDNRCDVYTGRSALILVPVRPDSSLAPIGQAGAVHPASFHEDLTEDLRNAALAVVNQ
jgi:hypothetical protein